MNISNLIYIVYGFLTGLTQLLPVSSQAHCILARKLMGIDTIQGLPMLLIHLAILAAVYSTNREILQKMLRARRLAMIPKKKRKRPLDVHSMLDLHFWYTTMIPVIFAALFYGRVSSFSIALPILAILLFANGMILYIPQFFPESNKDSRSLSRTEGILMGLGGALGVIPGISSLGCAVSAASVCGIERGYALTMAQLLESVWLAALAVYDIADIVNYGVGNFTFQVLIVYAAAAFAAFAAARLASGFLRRWIAESDYHVFAFYCWGISLFIFILNLLA